MRVKVKVIANAKKARIVVTEEGLKVYVNALAAKGRANKKLIALLAEYYKTKKHNISIVSGTNKPSKVVAIN